MVTKRQRLGGGINQEIGINTYALLYIKQITSKDLLYSTGNSTQYSLITYKGKESEKEQIYVYVKLNHFAVHLKLTQHCKSTILQYKIKSFRNPMTLLSLLFGSRTLNSLVQSFGPETFFIGRVLISQSIYLIDKGLVDISFLLMSL